MTTGSSKKSVKDWRKLNGEYKKKQKTIQKQKEKLWEEQEEYFKNVLVEVYSESSSTEITNANITNAAHSGSYAEQIFFEINKAEPLTLIDIPGVASRSERKIITEAVMTLHRRYPEMFSPSQRCRTPNVNIDNLCSSIFGANALQHQKN